MKLPPESRNENRTLQMIMSKALAKSTEVTAIVLLSVLETSVVYQRSCVLCFWLLFSPFLHITELSPVLEVTPLGSLFTTPLVSFLLKLQACNFIIKEILRQMFSCEFCKKSKNTLFTEHLWETASVFETK